MKRIAVLTAGGDTPALNATIHGAVTRANKLRIEVIGLVKGFNCLFNPRVPHVHLNPLFQAIPELDPTKGGTLIGSSRDYVDPAKREELDAVTARLIKLGIEGVIAIGGDGTLNGLQPLAERLPAVLAPKTIDNDLGLNYPSEPTEWVRTRNHESGHYHYSRTASSAVFDLNQMVNYVTPGYATAVMATGASRSSRSWAAIPATSRLAPPTGSPISCWSPNRRSTWISSSSASSTSTIFRRTS
jgi:6-phosphofructokinase 1